MASSEDMVRETIVQQMGLSPAAVTLNARLVEDLNFSPLDMVKFHHAGRGAGAGDDS